MLINEIFAFSVKRLGVKPLLSNKYMLSFFKKFYDAIVSRMWKFKRAKNAKYEDIDFLKVFFFSEVIGRSIHDTSEMLNKYILSRRKGRRKLFADGRKNENFLIKPKSINISEKLGL